MILLTAAAVSIVHYADNYLNYEDFPQTDAIPAPSATLVGLSWFGFTAFGIAGYVQFRRRHYRIASLCLGFYAGSGLVGFGHYLSADMTEAVWWRQTHVVADIVLGVAILTFAVWTATRMQDEDQGLRRTLARR